MRVLSFVYKALLYTLIQMHPASSNGTGRNVVRPFACWEEPRDGQQAEEIGRQKNDIRRQFSRNRRVGLVVTIVVVINKSDSGGSGYVSTIA
jgi:hypothetical protein